MMENNTVFSSFCQEQVPKDNTRFTDLYRSAIGGQACPLARLWRAYGGYTDVTKNILPPFKFLRLYLKFNQVRQKNYRLFRLERGFLFFIWSVIKWGTS
jgi:hypothetical protein